MTINYGSAAHIIYIIAAIAICVVLFLLLRGKSQKIQKCVILAIMLMNVAQHLFKSLIYPQYAGLGFTSLNTAYNMCATLILISPLTLITKSRLLRDFVFYVGSIAGMIAIVIPYWNIGDSAFDPEFVRSFICHTMLFVSSLLPLLLGLHKPSYKCFPKIGLCFIGVVVIIVLNDALCVLLGIHPGVEELSFSDALYAINPVWSFGPPEQFSWVLDIAKAFSPDAWITDNAAGRCLPVLWYAIPMYLIITVIAFVICTAVDRKGFKEDIRKFFTKK